MTDNKLFALAAKAAGYEIEIDWQGVIHLHEASGPQSWTEWNPLDDDGDALRLAVSLRMNIDVGAKPVVFTEASVIVDAMRIGAEEYHDSDPYAATRRAIVRAAAEIGRKME